ncbi:hypothetical protein [Spirosoma aerolatum]|uniref:hypothetical protein n=1 Tax=Spirosoma aerolatum TaxID=1211326 RepID=UPI0009AC06FD|nr:hypothetical protein [Spirosoma aerolatum]
MTNPKPFEAGGKIWDEFVMKLIIDGFIRPDFNNPDADFSTSKIVMILIPARRENAKIEVLTDSKYQIVKIWEDVFANQDMNLLLTVGGIKVGVQNWINQNLS